MSKVIVLVVLLVAIILVFLEGVQSFAGEASTDSSSHTGW